MNGETCSTQVFNPSERTGGDSVNSTMLANSVYGCLAALSPAPGSLIGCCGLAQKVGM